MHDLCTRSFLVGRHAWSGHKTNSATASAKCTERTLTPSFVLHWEKRYRRMRPELYRRLENFHVKGWRKEGWHKKTFVVLNFCSIRGTFLMVDEWVPGAF